MFLFIHLHDRDRPIYVLKLDSLIHLLTKETRLTL